MKETNRKQSRVKGTEDRRVVEFFVRHGQFLLPMIDLIEQSGAAIDEMIDVVGRGAVEAVLQLSAQELIGGKSQGRKVERANEVGWHGRQWGSVALSDRKLRVERPRLRDRAGEVAIPAYAALQDDVRMSARM
ncbi:MAG: IS256 family transposase, partial [Pyrinomonadaceae bacterium]